MADEKKSKNKIVKAKKEDEKKQVKKRAKKKNVIKPVVANNEIFEKSGKLKNRLYFSFKTRFLVNLFLVILLLGCLIVSIFMSFSITKAEKINYSNESSIDYKVYLNDNDFYDEKYLNKGMAYVASLIDKININYNFLFKTNKNINIDISYKVMAKLVIESQNNSKIFFENEYEISKEEVRLLENEKEYIIDKDIVIDYDYYNDLANKFKSQYAVNTTSYLDVYLQVTEKNREDNSYKIDTESTTTLTIPLSEQEINIGLNEKTVNEKKQIISESKFVLNDVRFIVFDVILFLFSVIGLTLLLKKITILVNKKSKYDRYVNKLLRGYDRLIVNVKTAPNFEDYNVIKVESFEELLDVRDNIKEPIKYFVVIEHQKCEFFITNQNDLYLYVVKSVDLENR